MATRGGYVPPIEVDESRIALGETYYLLAVALASANDHEEAMTK